MTIRKLTATLLAFALSACGITVKAEVAMDSAKQAEMIAMYQQMNIPGEEHKRLAELAGDWDIEVRVWPQPGAEPMVFNGKATNKLILGGRFLECRSQSGEGEMRTETLTLLGFDKRHKKYTSVGYDTWGTYYVAASGAYDDKAKAIVMSGEDYDPIMKGTQTWDFILKIIDKDKHTWAVVFTDEVHTQGKGPFKMVEVTNTRAKTK